MCGMVERFKEGRDALYHLVDGDLMRLYRFTVLYGDGPILLSKRSIKETLSGKRVIEGARRAVLLLGPRRALDLCGEVPVRYHVSKRKAERLLIETLIEAGWTSRMVKRSTGFTPRKVERILRRIEYGE